LSHNGCTAGNFDLPDYGFLLLTRGICLIYMSSFYFWSPRLARKMRKTNMRYYPEYPSGCWQPSYFNLPPDIGFISFTPIKGRIDSLTVYIYKAETCTNILRYNTCMSSYRYYSEYPSGCWHPILAP
jgi:hypothetical protein